MSLRDLAGELLTEILLPARERYTMNLIQTNNDT